MRQHLKPEAHDKGKIDVILHLKIMWNIRKVVSKGDYNYAVVPEHPFATKNGYVLEHRVVMENYLCRLLTPAEIIHHVNEHKKDNRIENLQVTTQSEHARRHGYQQGKMYAEMQCPECCATFVIPRNQTFYVKHYKYTCCSRSCRGKFSRRIQLQGILPETKTAIANNLIYEFKYTPVLAAPSKR